MGTSIWVYVERRYHRDGDPQNPWRFQLQHDQGRNYDLFGRLAEVRPHEEGTAGPLFTVRGLPGTASPEVRAQCNLIEGHHSSWISLDEAERVRNLDRSFDALLDYLAVVNDLGGGPSRYDTRIVYFFDN